MLPFPKTGTWVTNRLVFVKQNIFFLSMQIWSVHKMIHRATISGAEDRQTETANRYKEKKAKCKFNPDRLIV